MRLPRRLHPAHGRALGRLAVVALVAATISGGLWGLSHAVRQPGSDAGPTAGPTVADLTVASLVVAALPSAPGPPSMASAAALPSASGPADPATPAGTPAAARAATPQAAGWAAQFTAWVRQTSSLVALPPPELTGAATAELTMRQRAPSCHLSWVTVAALGVIDPARLSNPDAPTATAHALCADGRDTATATGWTAAVKSLNHDPAHLEKVLAVATSYAAALRSGVTISAAARAAVDFAVQQIGLPYMWGGNGPQNGDAGFDCSGLTSAAYASTGITLPRTADSQYRATPRVAPQDLRPGDLVFYGNPASFIHHVGLYLGNGVMVNAPTFGMPVQVAPVHTLGDDLAGAGRPA